MRALFLKRWRKITPGQILPIVEITNMGYKGRIVQAVVVKKEQRNGDYDLILVPLEFIELVLDLETFRNSITKPRRG